MASYTPVSSKTPAISIESTPDASPGHQSLVIQEFVCHSPFGDIAVHIAGDRKKPAILTYHDLGLNGLACFQNFFDSAEMTPVSSRFCIYHINAPGQEDGSSSFPDHSTYPSMPDLAESIVYVSRELNIKSFIGLGVGAGANVLCRFALKHSEMVEALILINCSISSTGWLQWGYQKANMFYLKNRGSMNSLTVEYLMWHNFGRSPDLSYDEETLTNYRSYFTNLPNPRNLARFIDSYITRSAIDLRRQGPTLSCPTLQLVGDRSPLVNETISLNEKLDPTKSNWLKISGCGGMVLEERPDKAAGAILLFLQGLSYIPAVNYRKWSSGVAIRRRSLTEMIDKCGRSQRSMSICAPSSVHQILRAAENTAGRTTTIISPELRVSANNRRSYSVANSQLDTKRFGENPLMSMFDQYHHSDAKNGKKSCTLETIAEPPPRNASPGPGHSGNDQQQQTAC